jgi:uncharacterized protein YjbI with pentapeptide repeats
MSNKIVLPKIKDNLMEYLGYINSDVDNVLIKDRDINRIVENVIFDGCRLEKVSFNELNDCEMIDCILDKCDLSNSNFLNKGFHRVVFRNCNLVGVSFINCSFNNVIMENCKGDYINISNCKIRNMSISSCCLRDGSFKSNDWNNFIDSSNNWSRGEFLDNNLLGVDFSSSIIDEVKIDFKSVKGISVNLEQGLMLVSMLGVKIK